MSVMQIWRCIDHLHPIHFQLEHPQRSTPVFNIHQYLRMPKQTKHLQAMSTNGMGPHGCRIKFGGVPSMPTMLQGHNMGNKSRETSTPPYHWLAELQDRTPQQHSVPCRLSIHSMKLNVS